MDRIACNSEGIEANLGIENRPERMLAKAPLSDMALLVVVCDSGGG
eukprot:CAMPEP_0185257172 /NCGR_PEP_ID=MMETSP1359-20130426/6241_1 /TAXON_ID=552665 /ORGANISM="Bigelowiella longifila, Strain CCMP242" /LENGTH=45 /DNA_ID= /DNA_START= /DNA_END= /DNA_ORIENTATION=